jgi:hypothetical protein
MCTVYPHILLSTEVVATALEKNQTLTRIDMRHNLFTAKGVARFSKVMTRNNTPLEWVNMQSWC